MAEGALIEAENASLETQLKKKAAAAQYLTQEADLEPFRHLLFSNDAEVSVAKSLLKLLKHGQMALAALKVMTCHE